MDKKVLDPRMLRALLRHQAAGSDHHKLLATALPAPGFVTVDLRHHGLMTSAEGAKLSKSAGAQAHPMEHTRARRNQVLAHAEMLGPSIGINRP